MSRSAGRSLRAAASLTSAPRANAGTNSTVDAGHDLHDSASLCSSSGAVADRVPILFEDYRIRGSPRLRPTRPVGAMSRSASRSLRAAAFPHVSPTA